VYLIDSLFLFTIKMELKMDSNVTNWLIYLRIGAISGWLGSNLIRGAGLGLVGNIIAGIVGSFVGGYFLGNALGNGLLGHIITSALGAALVLFAISLIKKV
jgi:uncharacterized membrane protein YeaQ/YmgE (transglycosylase-associated protein family)